MNSRPVAPLVALVVLYLLVIRSIFGWLMFVTRGDTFLLMPRLSLGVVQTWLPYVVGIACIVGLARRQASGWYLTALAVLYELAVFVPGLRLPESSPASLAAWFKLLWLLAIAWCLFRLRFGPRAEAKVSANGNIAI